MLDTLYGLYLGDKFGVKSDRITWAKSIGALQTLDITITDALNGVSLKNDLSGSKSYVLYKHTMWSQNGVIEVTLKPDDENSNAIKTYALTQKLESLFIPPKVVDSDISITLTNNQDISDDVVIVLDILKVNNTQDIIDIAESMAVAPENIDLQTLGIQSDMKYTNQLLELLLEKQGGDIPEESEKESTTTETEVVKTGVCKRT